jgi:argininosuccinate lyase
MRLWDAAGTSPDAAILAFTVGDDPQLDLELVAYDCLASAAHAEALASAELLTAGELAGLRAGLAEARQMALAGRFEILAEQEDGHTALEAFLTEKLGEAGKKIHTGRSRNDQVMAALRLLVRDRLLGLADRLAAVVGAALARGSQHRSTPMPGYTHTRQAMPSSVGQWFFAVAEDLLRDLELLPAVLAQANRSVLGAASGYGVPLPLDREAVANRLGLDGLELNTLHAQNSRGRLEAVVLFALHQLAITLGRAATDLIGFSSEAYRFVRLPEALTTGSSIMPQKRNPDVLELVRTLAPAMQARYVEVTGVLHGLGAGYHRDLQRTKGPLLRGLAESRAALAAVQLCVEQLEVDTDCCRAALTPDIFATDRVYSRVRDGAAFRDAYREVKGSPAEALDPDDTLAARTHAGAPGSDQAPALGKQLERTLEALEHYRHAAEHAAQIL